MAYVYLDRFFFAFHTALVVFILFGWLWRSTRPWHLALVAATAFSWGVLGLWFGFGYCPCTDWHWQVRYRLGYDDMPASYLKYLLDHLTGQSWTPELVDGAALVVFVASGLFSAILLFIDRHRQQKQQKTDT